MMAFSHVLHLVFLLTSLPCLLQIESQIDHKEEDALLSFKSRVSGGGAIMSSWDHSRNACEWKGVACSLSQPQHVVGLRLKNLSMVGTISPRLSNLTYLQVLDLSRNMLHGDIPRELGLLAKLRVLNLAFNNLRGTIPPALSLLAKLEVLHLQDNNLTGHIPSSFRNLTLLNVLHLAYNNLNGGVPPELGHLAGLQLLDLQFNSLSGDIPRSIFGLSSLHALALGGNSLTGSLPSDLGRYLPFLVDLFLFDNHIEGCIPPSIVDALSIERIELSHNKFAGSVPLNLGSLSSLVKLNLGNNMLSGGMDFIQSLVRCRELEELDVSYNNLEGTIPHSIGNFSMQLKWMRLRGNRLTGRLPASIVEIRNIIVLDVEGNRLTGSIPSNIGKLSQLESLNLRHNYFTGSIPTSLGDIVDLGELLLGGNHFYGKIPSKLSALLSLDVLDVSSNDFRGPISIDSIPPHVISLNFSNNKFKGKLPNYIAKLANLNSLDASRNKLSGTIPYSLGRCIALEYLNLAGNKFEGTIPEDFSNLRGIQILDISQNMLSGQIPKSLESLQSILFLNLSFNNFEGEVPMEGIFANLTAYSIFGNKNICGGPPELKLAPCSSRKHHFLPTKSALVVIAALGSLFVVLILSCWTYKVIKSSGTSTVSKNTWDYRLPRISFTDLRRATNNFSSANLVGGGGSASVYRGYLENEGKEVAVKVFDNEQAALNSFHVECEVLRSVRHRNLVRVLSSCSSVDSTGNDFIALVFEYMPKGDLSAWLHGDAPSTTVEECNLNILRRLDVAIDIASALDYLHNDQVSTAIIHCDLNPTNVLLDNDFTAHLCDFGISRKLSGETEEQSISIDIKGSIGYMAPEYAMGGPVSKLWDIYSYGIILLELFTKKRPTDEIFIKDMDIQRFVERSIPHKLQDVVDPNLLLPEGGGFLEHKSYLAIKSTMEIALLCAQKDPSKRLDTGNILGRLKKIRRIFLHVGVEEEGTSNN